MTSEMIEPAMIERSKARLNRTVAALMQRGIDLALARKLHEDGYTLGRLQQLGSPELKHLGIKDDQIACLQQGGRAAIPFRTLARLLWQNRFTCCVCRDPAKAVIVHHIRHWAESRDHSLANLTVLCLEHHAQAHRTGNLEQNLSERHLREFKASWEELVSHLDPKAILEASRIPGHHWWWFNHLRIFEMAENLEISLRENPYFISAKRYGRIDERGRLNPTTVDSPYLYVGGDGMALYGYMRCVLESVLSRTTVFNISDDLDPGFLAKIVNPGDLVLVEGKHFFKSLSKTSRGPGQASEVRREANNVRVSFTVDRWEAVANSAWAVWLTGAKSASSIVRIASVECESGKTHLRCTGLAMGALLQGISRRSYAFPTWPHKEYDDDEEWLTGFGDELEIQ